MAHQIYTHEKSRELFAKAAAVIPSGVYGHLGPAEGCFIPVEAFPLFGDRAKGSYFWDVDGNRYIDYMCAYGPNILGYGDPDVDEAAAKQREKGDCTTSPSPVMIDFADLLVDTVKCADWAFFAKNGNDVTSTAIMCARAYTHRKKIIFFRGYYHGVSPWCQKIDYSGIIEEDVMHNIYLDWNDIDGVREAFEKYKGEIAAVISQPYMHGNFFDNIMPADGFWQEVRRLCTENGTVLIVDDVRAGWRIDLRGSDNYFGFEADLICFCKALANGYNMSAVCGREEFKATAASLSFTGSYWMSAEPFAACIACIDKMKRLDTPSLFRRMGEKLTQGFQAAARAHGFDLVVSGEPALFYLRIANDDSLMLHQEWVAECVSRGLFLASHHNHFMNAAMTEADIALAVDIADDAFGVVAARHPEIRG